MHGFTLRVVAGLWLGNGRQESAEAACWKRLQQRRDGVMRERVQGMAVV